jgi:hypothetical protein
LNAERILITTCATGHYRFQAVELSLIYKFPINYIHEYEVLRSLSISGMASVNLECSLSRVDQPAAQLIHQNPKTSAVIPSHFDKHSQTSLKVRLGLVLSTSSNSNLVNNDSLASAASDLDINRLLTETRGVLEEVVVLALSCFPGLTAVDRYLDILDRLVGVDDLDGEPIGRGARLVVKHKRSSNATLDKLVGGLDDTVCAADGLEGVGEEIEMAGFALGTLVDNLNDISYCV